MQSVRWRAVAAAAILCVATSAAGALSPAASISASDELFVPLRAAALRGLLTFAANVSSSDSEFEWAQYEALLVSRARASPLVLFFGSTPDDCEMSAAAAESDKDEDDDELQWFRQSAPAEPASRECIDTKTQDNALLVDALDATARAYAGLRIVSVPKELLDAMLRYVSAAFTCFSHFSPRHDATVAAVGPAALVAKLPAVRALRDELSGSVVARQAPRDLPAAAADQQASEREEKRQVGLASDQHGERESSKQSAAVRRTATRRRRERIHPPMVREKQAVAVGGAIQSSGSTEQIVVVRGGIPASARRARARRVYRVRQPRDRAAHAAGPRGVVCLEPRRAVRRVQRHFPRRDPPHVAVLLPPELRARVFPPERAAAVRARGAAQRLVELLDLARSVLDRRDHADAALEVGAQRHARAAAAAHRYRVHDPALHVHLQAPVALQVKKCH